MMIGILYVFAITQRFNIDIIMLNKYTDTVCTSEADNKWLYNLYCDDTRLMTRLSVDKKYFKTYKLQCVDN